MYVKAQPLVAAAQTDAGWNQSMVVRVCQGRGVGVPGENVQFLLGDAPYGNPEPTDDQGRAHVTFIGLGEGTHTFVAELVTTGQRTNPLVAVYKKEKKLGPQAEEVVLDKVYLGGQQFQVTVTATSKEHSPVPNLPLRMVVDGVPSDEATGPNGIYSFRFTLPGKRNVNVSVTTERGTEWTTLYYQKGKR